MFVFNKNGYLQMRYSNLYAAQYTVNALKTLKTLQYE
ncbi:hypothetical protein SAMN04487764_1890 [Gillisia sp. Hel1_33_143]|nr:hypothetical protein SAMN04487764_1890 [Gillisia sp. Hel1_33_143]